jgi:CAAX prenyl protease-like protein
MCNQPGVMTNDTSLGRATAAYAAPFLVFIATMALEKGLALPPLWLYPIRCICTLLTLHVVGRPVIRLVPSYTAFSVVLGIAVFLVWISPDLLFGYRNHWLFENSITGKAVSSLPEELRRNVVFVVVRIVSCSFLVPVVEELFWRGWLLRWLDGKDVRKSPFAYAPAAFWIVVALFASEHGPYWEVGAIAGAIYNWWVIRTQNLADCICAHSVTNMCLSAYVLSSGRWEYLL